MSMFNGSSDERLDSDFVPSYTYEVEAMRVIPGHKGEKHEPVERCTSEEAEFWSVYRRPVKPDERGQHLAEWVSDRNTQVDANLEADRLRKLERSK